MRPPDGKEAAQLMWSIDKYGHNVVSCVLPNFYRVMRVSGMAGGDSVTAYLVKQGD